MPRSDELPANRVGWRPDPTRCALLVHDMQRHFLAPFDATAEPIPQLIEGIDALRTAADAAGAPVFFSAQPGGQTPDQRGLLTDFWGDGIPADGDAAEIIPALTPRGTERRLTKWRYSTFVNTDLLERLRDAGRDQLLICGVYAHIGCLTTAVHAFMEGVQPFVVADAVADFSADDHRMALSWTARRRGVVTTTAQVVATREGEDPLLTRVRAEVAERLVLDPAQLDDDANLVDLGLDSMRLMDLVATWRAAGYDVDFGALADCHPSVSTWHATLQASRARAALR